MPSSPEAISRWASRYPASNRRWKPSWNAIPDRSMCVGDGDRGRDVRRERLLAERRQAAVGSGPDQVGVGRGRGGDHDRLGLAEGRIETGGRTPAHLGRRLGGSFGQRIGDDQVVDTGRRREDPGVEPADPTGTEAERPSSPAPAVAAVVVAPAVAAAAAGPPRGWRSAGAGPRPGRVGRSRRSRRAAASHCPARP